MLDKLPFREIWAADFEFTSAPGENPGPVCLVARELRSGRLLRLWRDQFPSQAPFPVDERSAFVAYAAQAEFGCFLQLGWPLPVRILDLYAEFRALTNGLKLPHGRGLLAALAHYGIPAITSDEKQEGRALVLKGGPWDEGERIAILDYCQTDVDVLSPLLERMVPTICASTKGLGQALLRGRYTAAIAHMERTGAPIDTPTLSRLRARWEAIKLELIGDIDRDYGVFEGTVFKADRFLRWLTRQGIAWPLTETGKPSLDRDTFRDMSKLHPSVAPLQELRHALSDLRLERLAVGRDGRNRVSLMPFGASSGRNTPPATEYIFGPSVWLRGLLQPAPGRAIAYIDWSAQEVVIAAALSHDERLLNAVQSGDPYLAFAKMSGLAPPGASKQTHAQVRSQCKACVLGANYGMGAMTLAYRIGASRIHAEHLLMALARTFPDYWRWAEYVQDIGALAGRLNTVFGWPLHVTAETRTTTVRNFLMQATGAEMLRLACCMTTEQGAQVCAPVHDALLVESSAGEIEEVAESTSGLMRQAARHVLGGVDVGTDATIIRWPDRYSDPRGVVMWNRVDALLQRAAA